MLSIELDLEMRSVRTIEIRGQGLLILFQSRGDLGKGSIY